MTPVPGGAGSARERAVALFAAAFGESPSRLIRSPGRVNLIGEHTDYNGGRCLPLAIDLELCLAFGPHPPGGLGGADPGPAVEIVSESEPERAAVALPPPAPPPPGPVRPAAGAQAGWAGYVEGVVVMSAAAAERYADGVAVRREGLRGWRGAVASDLPTGAGLSSSAALELAVARACSLAWPPASETGARSAWALGSASGWASGSASGWDPIQAARLAQRAENAWVGAPTGLLDQLACAAGVAGHALLLDFADDADVSVEPVPLPAQAVVAVVDTDTRRKVVTSAYAQRRAECERAASGLGVTSLRDFGARLPADAAELLDPVALRRARHVVTEFGRVSELAAALRRFDLAQAGALLVEGHRSLRDDFEVSGPELDAAVAACLEAPGCYGARMTGGGFAGCAVALVERAAAESFTEAVIRRYRQVTGRQARIHLCTPVQGTSMLPLW